MFQFYRLIRQKPAQFLSAQMDLVSTFFQVFIVFGMHNFNVVHNYFVNQQKTVALN